MDVVPVVTRTLNITGFVMVMMLLIEYVHVYTNGVWQTWLARSRWGQYVLAALLGAIPGCLGAFVVVGMYAHGIVSTGALVTTMVATSGDEAFVMLAMMPGPALVLMIVLVAVALLAGMATDLIGDRRRENCAGLEVHGPDQCQCLVHGQILRQLRELTPLRGVLIAVLALFLAALFLGIVGPPRWNWVRVSFVLLTSMSLLIVATVPEHFLEDHLWRHVLRRHLLPVLMWTAGALMLMQLLSERMDLSSTMQQERWVLLIVAALVGLIPESGPHLVFVTLYAQGALPFGVLLASSIVQDGHGMLPLLACSRRAFVKVKAINLLVGLLVGAIVLLLDIS